MFGGLDSAADRTTKLESNSKTTALSPIPTATALVFFAEPEALKAPLAEGA